MSRAFLAVLVLTLGGCASTTPALEEATTDNPRIVALELIGEDSTHQARTAFLVLEGQVATYQIKPGVPVLGIRVESISTGGETVTLGLYRLKDKDDSVSPGTRIEEIRLGEFGATIRVSPTTRAYMGGSLLIRLEHVREAKR